MLIRLCFKCCANTSVLIASTVLIANIVLIVWYQLELCYKSCANFTFLIILCYNTVFFANNGNFEFALFWCNFRNFTFCVLFSGLKFPSVLFFMFFPCLDFKSLLLRCIRVLVKREVMPCSGKYTIVLASRNTLHSSSVFFLLFLTLAGQKRPILLWASAFISWLPISAKRIVTSIWHHLLYPGLPELKFTVQEIFGAYFGLCWLTSLFLLRI